VFTQIDYFQRQILHRVDLVDRCQECKIHQLGRQIRSRKTNPQVTRESQELRLSFGLLAGSEVGPGQKAFVGSKVVGHLGVRQVLLGDRMLYLSVDVKNPSRHKIKTYPLQVIVALLQPSSNFCQGRKANECRA